MRRQQLKPSLRACTATLFVSVAAVVVAAVLPLKMPAGCTPLACAHRSRPSHASRTLKEKDREAHPRQHGLRVLMVVVVVALGEKEKEEEEKTMSSLV
jgi:hypothetical protein